MPDRKIRVVKKSMLGQPIQDGTEPAPPLTTKQLFRNTTRQVSEIMRQLKADQKIRETKFYANTVPVPLE